MEGGWKGRETEARKESDWRVSPDGREGGFLGCAPARKSDMGNGTFINVFRLRFRIWSPVARSTENGFEWRMSWAPHVSGETMAMPHEDGGAGLMLCDWLFDIRSVFLLGPCGVSLIDCVGARIALVIRCAVASVCN